MSPAAAERAALALWVTLAVLTLARAAFTFVPGTWGWALSTQRFLAPPVAWLPWLLAVLALVPAVSRRALPLVSRWGDAIGRRPTLSTGAWALVAALLAFLMPDQVRFVGDFLLRQGTVEVAELPANLYPQALPLDVLLHYNLQLGIVQLHLLDANGAARVLGVLEAALLATCATAFARALELRGGAAFACAATVLFGGYLGMFTGFSKAFAELCVTMALAGASAVRVVRSGRGLVSLGFAVGLAILLHRSALGMLPALALVWGVWIARHAGPGWWRRPAVWLAAALPVAATASMAKHIIGSVLRYDTSVHFAPAEVQAHGGVLAAAFAGNRPFDLVNLILMLSPIALAILPATIALGRRGWFDAERIVLAVLALPFVGVMPFIHPAQGLYRDWDAFAASGVAVSLVAAWLAGTTLRAAPRFAWLAVAVSLGVLAPTFQWLWIHTDTARGLARVRAFVSEPPRRSGAERGLTWDYLGIHAYRSGRYAEAEAALSRAVETAPSPRIVQEWAITATMAGDLQTSRRAHERLLAENPDVETGWLGLAAVCYRLGDYAEAKRAALRLRALNPQSVEAERFLAAIARHDSLVADSLRQMRSGAGR